MTILETMSNLTVSSKTDTASLAASLSRCLDWPALQPAIQTQPLAVLLTVSDLPFVPLIHVVSVLLGRSSRQIPLLTHPHS